MKHVLAVRSDSLGDVLLTGPAIRALADRARVTLLCGPRGLAAAELLPGIDEVLCQELPWIDPEPKAVEENEMLELVGVVAGLAVDEAVIFTSFHQSPLPLALLFRMAEVGRIAAISDDYPGTLLDLRHRPGDGHVHEVERALSLAEAAGYPLPAGDDGRLRILERASAPPEVAELAGYVVLHPGVSVPARAWPPESFAELARLLEAEGRTVVVTGGPGELGVTSLVAGGKSIDLGGRLNLAQLAAVLAGADCVVVSNTGPAHLAAAVETPVVSLFAPTVPAARWRPWRVPQVLLGDQNAPCAGTRARQCPVAGHPCLSRVTAEEALAAVRQLAPAREPLTVGRAG